MTNKVFYIKIVGAQLVAFAISSYLVTHVFLGPIPVIRSDVQKEVAESPKKIVEYAKELPAIIASAVKEGSVISQKPQNEGSTNSNVPPPWIFDEGPTPLPTSARVITQAPQQPTQAPIPTFDPGPLPTAINQPTSRPQPTGAPTSVPTVRPTSSPSGGGSGGGRQTGNASLEQQTVDEINRRRKEVGLRELRVNSQLTQAARVHSADMSAKNECGHIGSDGSKPSDRVKDAGYSGRAYGETVSCWARTPQQAVDGWWGSPPHHAILTNGTITEIGLGWVNTHQTAVVGL